MRLFEVFFNTVYIFRTLLRDFSFFFCQFECRIVWHLKVKRNSLGRKSYSLLNDFYFWDYSDCVIEEMPWIRLLLPLFRPKSIVIQHWINSQGAPFKVGKRSSVYIFFYCVASNIEELKVKNGIIRGGDKVAEKHATISHKRGMQIKVRDN